jgi:hypothetical protein
VTTTSTSLAGVPVTIVVDPVLSKVKTSPAAGTPLGFQFVLVAISLVVPTQVFAVALAETGNKKQQKSIRAKME